MTIRVDSEIGRLRRVLIHQPGHEIEWMVPSMMERLLFDDILDLSQARREHDLFRRVLEKAGVETLDPETLLVEVLAKAEAREDALAGLERDYGLSAEQRRHLEGLPPEELGPTLIRGVRSDAEGHPRHYFELDPVPNYFFQRDPQVVIGDRVVISSMETEAREREPFLARTVFAHHPALASHRELIDLEAPASRAPEHQLGFPYPHLEGGDVLVVSPELLLVGISARTNSQGAEMLAHALRERQAGFRRMLFVQLPAKRSYMHLDTVFTFIDHGLCLGFLPVVQAGRAESARVYCVDLTAPEVALLPKPSLEVALAEEGVAVEILPCGGGEDIIFQEREQWTDGANAFALAPGVIAIYRRNHHTLEELRRRGWRILQEREALEDGVEILGQGPTAVTLRAAELSRARGGPRCMTMPLLRDPV